MEKRIMEEWEFEDAEEEIYSDSISGEGMNPNLV
jgi:hypothetical protein